jgi:hypothetical protein
VREPIRFDLRRMSCLVRRSRLANGTDEVSCSPLNPLQQIGSDIDRSFHFVCVPGRRRGHMKGSAPRIRWRPDGLGPNAIERGQLPAWEWWCTGGALVSFSLLIDELMTFRLEFCPAGQRHGRNGKLFLTPYY